MQGLLIPKFHKNYWMGLAPNWTSEAQPVPWGWIDKYQPGPDSKVFANWGVLQDPPSEVPEPNQYTGNESCSVGNWSQAMGNPVGWGWADTNCNNTFYPLCRKQSESAKCACCGAVTRCLAPHQGLTHAATHPTHPQSGTPPPSSPARSLACLST